LKIALFGQLLTLGIGSLWLASGTLPRGSLAQGAPITPDSLQNLTYNIPNYGRVTLNNGNFQGNAGRMSAVVLSKDALIGNFNTNSNPDGVVVLKVTFDPSTGMRPKYYLALVTNDNGTPNNVNTVFIGEGIAVDRVVTQDGTVTVTMGKFYPGDAPCCPMGITTARYTIDPTRSRLILTSIQDQYQDTVSERDFPVPPVLDDNLPFQPPADEIQVNF
jgi:hypothetical protein